MSKKPPPPKRPAPQSRAPSRRPPVARLGLGVLAVAVLAAAFVLPGQLSGKGHASERIASGKAPGFSERDAVTGQPVTSRGLLGQNVLLFFSEGVMCQACFEQIQSLQARASDLKRRGLVLVNITTDPPGALRDAASAYGITTPLVSDEDRNMSGAYGVLGQGMHPDTAGHTFVLVDGRGQIRWRRDFKTMYVPPQQLLGEIPRV